MISTSEEWDIVSQIPGESWFAARLYYGDQTSYLSVGSKDFELDDEKFLGIISNKPSISGGFDIQTRECQINSGLIVMINQIDQVTTFGELASTLGSGNNIGYENRRVDIRLMKDGITKFENGYPLLQRGRMYRPGYGSGKVEIRVEDNTKNRFGTIGEIVTQDDARSGYTLPASSAGRIKPVIYGPHRWTINAGDENTLTKEDWDPLKQPRFVPMVNLGGGNWMVEDHEIAGTPTKNDGDVIWGKDSATGNWVQLVLYSVVQNSGTGVIVNVSTGSADWYDYALPVTVDDIGVFSWANALNAIDRNVATAATAAVNGAANTAILRFTMPKIIVSGSNDGGKLFLTGNGDWGSKNELFVDSDQNKFFSPADLTTTFKGHAGFISEADQDVIDLIFRAPGAPTVNASVLEVYRRVVFGVNSIEGDLFWGGQGHALENWVDDADRSSHFDFGNSGDPAENPASVVESLARNDMDFTDDDINMPSMDEASNDLAAYLANFSITVETDLKVFLSRMGRQFKSVVCNDTNSELTMFVISDLYTSADVIVNYNDIADLEFGRTDDDQLTSKVIVEYSFDGSQYLNNTNEIENTTTRTRYALSEAATSRSIKAELIDDEATADLLAEFELAFWQQHHNTIKRIGLDQSFMKYTPGDIIRIEDLPEDQFPNGEDITEKFTRAGQDILPYFLITGFQKSDRVIYKGIQMHDTTP